MMVSSSQQPPLLSSSASVSADGGVAPFVAAAPPAAATPALSATGNDDFQTKTIKNDHYHSHQQNLSSWPRSLRWLYQLSEQERNDIPLVDWMEQQRARYDQLVASSSTLLENDDDEDDDDEEKEDGMEGDDDNVKDEAAAAADHHHHLLLDNDPFLVKSSSSASPPSLLPEESTAATTTFLIDPLTALVQEQEARDKRLGELELKYRKEKARQKRGLPTKPRRFKEHHGKHGDGGDDEENNDNDDEYDDDDDEHKHGATSSSSSIMMMDLMEMRNVLDKDLHRLPPEHAAARYSIQPPRRRSQLLRQVLLIHAQEHVMTLGYRQGMHEIASYLLMVLEQDVYDYQQQNQNQQQNQQQVASSTTIPKEFETLRASQATHMAHDTFIMLEIIMQWLAPAYDVATETIGITTTSPPLHGLSPTALSSSASKPSSSSSHQRHQYRQSYKPPMEIMATSVLTKVQQVDPALYYHLQRLQVPPQLYMTRWIRLMFAREVAQPQVVVGTLWDVFLDLQHANCVRQQQRQQQVQQQQVQQKDDDDDQNGNGNTMSCTTFNSRAFASQSWMNLLETCAAALILLQRPLLLPTPVAGRPPMETEDSIHILMNIPTMTNVTPLTTLLRQWMIIMPNGGDGGKGHQAGDQDPIQHISTLLASLLPFVATTTNNSSSPGRTSTTTNQVDASILTNSYDGQSSVRPSTGVGAWPSNGNGGGNFNDANHNSKKAFSFQAVRQTLRAAAAPAGESILRFYQDWAPPPQQPTTATISTTTTTTTATTMYPAATTTTSDGLFPPFHRSAPNSVSPLMKQPSTPPSSLPVWEDPLLRPPPATTSNPLIVDFQTTPRRSSTGGPVPQQLNAAFASSWQQQQQVPFATAQPQQQQLRTPTGLQQHPTVSAAKSGALVSPSSWGTAGGTMVKLPATTPSKPTLRHQLVLYAKQLENSVKILQDYCMEQQKQSIAFDTTTNSSSIGTGHGPSDGPPPHRQQNPNAMVPPQVWEALVDVDHVRKGLVEIATAAASKK